MKKELIPMEKTKREDAKELVEEERREIVARTLKRVIGGVVGGAVWAVFMTPPRDPFSHFITPPHRDPYFLLVSLLMYITACVLGAIFAVLGRVEGRYQLLGGPDPWDATKLTDEERDEIASWTFERTLAGAILGAMVLSAVDEHLARYPSPLPVYLAGSVLWVILVGSRRRK